MPLTLTDIAANPHLLTASLTTRSGEKLRIHPLEASDAEKLAEFLSRLSPETRRFSPFSSYDLEAAQEMCDAIAQYDKLRFVIENSAAMVGLLEFSFAILESDTARYAAYNITLDPATDCRFGLTLADDTQNKGVGTLAVPFILDVARKFGKKRILLWGGVFADNARAIRYYEKNGFKTLGKFSYPGIGELVDMMVEL
jgi:diamine N-acetyltransferase